jgi:hypothetical protein
MGHPHFTRFATVEGYAGRQSVAAGEAIDVHASSTVAGVHVEVARLGAERTLVWSGDVSVGDHPTPDDAWRAGCGWPVALTIETDTAWRPGMYAIELSTGDADGESSVAFVVIRHPGPDRPPILLHLATNTWQAYNQWGGKCLYSGADQVSFRRPIERGYITRPVDADGYDLRVANIGGYDPEHRRFAQYLSDHPTYALWSASGGWFNWERRFVECADVNGIELDFCVDADLDASVTPDPELLDGRRLLLTLGHNEYWSWGERDAADAFVDAGGNWMILSGNTCFRQVRYTDGADAMVCHKSNAHRRDPVVGTPRSSGGYTVVAADHWALAGTGLRYGDTVGSDSTAVGYEVDGCAFTVVDGVPTATGEDGTPESLEIVAVAPAHLLSITDEHCEAPAAMWASVDPPGDLEYVAATLFGDASTASTERITRGHAVMGVFTRGTGTVFNAGSANWCYGLGSDPLIEQITGNVITRLS